MSEVNHAKITPDLDLLYTTFRDRIVQEDNLINQRTTWFVTLQAFMFTSISLLAGEFTGYQFEFLVSCYGMIGIVVSFTTFLSVRAAQRANKTIKEKWYSLLSIYGPTYHPPIAGGGDNIGICFRGGVSSIVMPIAVGVSWILVIATVWLVDDPASPQDRVIESLEKAIENPESDIILPNFIDGLPAEALE